MIARAMAKSPDERFATAPDLVERRRRPSCSGVRRPRRVQANFESRLDDLFPPGAADEQHRCPGPAGTNQRRNGSLPTRPRRCARLKEAVPGLAEAEPSAAASGCARPAYVRLRAYARPWAVAPAPLGWDGGARRGGRCPRLRRLVAYLVARDDGGASGAAHHDGRHRYGRPRWPKRRPRSRRSFHASCGRTAPSRTSPRRGPPRAPSASSRT